MDLESRLHFLARLGFCELSLRTLEGEMVKKSILYTSVLIFVLLCLWMPSKCYAEEPNEKSETDVVIMQQGNNIEQREKDLEKKIKTLDVEIGASKRLLEISEKNLNAPKWVFGIIVGLIGAFGALVSGIIWVLRHGILKKIEEKEKELREDIDDKISQYIQSCDKIMKDITEIRPEHYELLAIDYDKLAFEAWRKTNLDKAIYYSEKAIFFGEKNWGKEPKKKDQKDTLNFYRSNLAYYYVEDNRRDKTTEAIKLARMGLETGQNIYELNLIDNFLYILMKFAVSRKDKENWVEIFETYGDKIFEASIRDENERKEYKKYYEKTKEELQK